MLHAMMAPTAKAMISLKMLWDLVPEFSQGFEMNLKSLRVHHRKPNEIDFEASIEGRFFWENTGLHWQRFDGYDGKCRGDHLHIVLFGEIWLRKKPNGDWVQVELGEIVSEETLTLWHEVNPPEASAFPHPTHLDLIKGDDETPPPLQSVIRYYRLKPNGGSYAHWTRWQRNGGSYHA